HRVVHSAGHHRLEPAAVRSAAEYVRGARYEGSFAGAFVGLLGECALAPINPAVGTGVRSVQIIGAARQRFALEPLLALFGHTVAIRVSQFPDARWRRDVEGTFEPQRAFGKHQLLSINGALIEA